MNSNRHIRQLIKEKKEKCQKRFWEIEKAQPPNELEVSDSLAFNTAGFNNHIEVLETEELGEETNDGPSVSQNSSLLNEKLRPWHNNHRESRECAKDLIKIFREENIDVSSF